LILHIKIVVGNHSVNQGNLNILMYLTNYLMALR